MDDVMGICPYVIMAYTIAKVSELNEKVSVVRKIVTSRHSKGIFYSGNIGYCVKVGFCLSKCRIGGLELLFREALFRNQIKVVF